jgi:predicted nucleic acid-binding protein
VEPGSEDARAAADRAEVVGTSELALVEARSALGRGVAIGRLSRRRRQRAVSDLRRLWLDIAELEVGRELIQRAGELAERYLLRAYDAVHLASALTLAGDATIEFACWDRELRSAAERAGLTVVPSST